MTLSCDTGNGECLFDDVFDRTKATLGTASTDEEYAANGANDAAASASVSNTGYTVGTATLSITSAATATEASWFGTLCCPPDAGIEGYVTFTLTAGEPIIEWWLSDNSGRAGSAVRVIVNLTSSTLTVTDGTDSQVVPFALAASTPYALRFFWDTIRLRAKLWVAADSEPSACQAHVNTASLTVAQIGYVLTRGSSSTATMTMSRVMLMEYAASSDAEPGVWIDWAQDGFDDGASSVSTDGRLARMLPEAGSSGTVNDNITTDVMDFQWTRGAAADHVGQPAPGTLTITVKNTTGKYTPENSSSVLYGKLRPGLPVWVGRNADGTLTGTGQSVYGVWAGYVRQIVPIPGEATTNTATAQIICEDPLGYYSRQPAKVEASITRSYRDLRDAVLDDIGESALRRNLAFEIDTLPLSSVDSDSALRVLESINTATASRHFIEPGDTKEDWYFYTVVDRHWKIGDATDFSLNADNIQGADGYRVTEENIVNFQQVDVSPARFPAGVDDVWTYADTTFPLTAPRTIWAQFEDFVKDAVVDYSSTGGAVTTSLTNFGTTAKLQLWSASSSVVINLSIEGRQVVRDATEAVTAEDTASQSIYGKKSNGSISSEYASTTALAQGVADFIVWKFATARPRMAVDITNLFSTLNDRTLYDTTALTFDRLYLVAKREEIIGEQGMCDVAASVSVVHWQTTYELQETPNQSALGLFTIGESLLGGSDVLAR